MAPAAPISTSTGTIRKDWKDNIAPWEMKPEVRKLADFHAIGVEGVEQK
jgi:hypothetical protein